jgi:hypothetical protein
VDERRGAGGERVRKPLPLGISVSTAAAASGFIGIAVREALGAPIAYPISAGALQRHLGVEAALEFGLAGCAS